MNYLVFHKLAYKMDCFEGVYSEGEPNDGPPFSTPDPVIQPKETGINWEVKDETFAEIIDKPIEEVIYYELEADTHNIEEFFMEYGEGQLAIRKAHNGEPDQEFVEQFSTGFERLKQDERYMFEAETVTPIPEKSAIIISHNLDSV